MRIRYMPYQETYEKPIIRIGVRSTSDATLLAAEVDECLCGFNGVVGWSPIGELLPVTDCDVIFHQVNLAQVNVGLRAGDGRDEFHWLPVTLIGVSDTPALPVVIHSLLAPSFAPGLIGVDWEDIRLMLLTGERGVLTFVNGEIESAMSHANELILPHMAGEYSFIGSSVVLISDGDSLTLDQISIAGRLARGLASELRVTSAPIAAAGGPFVAVLAIAGETSAISSESQREACRTATDDDIPAFLRKTEYTRSKGR